MFATFGWRRSSQTMCLGICDLKSGIVHEQLILLVIDQTVNTLPIYWRIKSLNLDHTLPGNKLQNIIQQVAHNMFVPIWKWLSPISLFPLYWLYEVYAATSQLALQPASPFCSIFSLTSTKVRVYQHKATIIPQDAANPASYTVLRLYVRDKRGIWW